MKSSRFKGFTDLYFNDCGRRFQNIANGRLYLVVFCLSENLPKAYAMSPKIVKAESKLQLSLEGESYVV